MHFKNFHPTTQKKYSKHTRRNCQILLTLQWKCAPSTLKTDRNRGVQVISKVLEFTPAKHPHCKKGSDFRDDFVALRNSTQVVEYETAKFELETVPKNHRDIADQEFTYYTNTKIITSNQPEGELIHL